MAKRDQNQTAEVTNAATVNEGTEETQETSETATTLETQSNEGETKGKGKGKRGGPRKPNGPRLPWNPDRDDLMIDLMVSSDWKITYKEVAEALKDHPLFAGLALDANKIGNRMAQIRADMKTAGTPLPEPVTSTAPDVSRIQARLAGLSAS